MSSVNSYQQSAEELGRHYQEAKQVLDRKDQEVKQEQADVQLCLDKTIEAFDRALADQNKQSQELLSLKETERLDRQIEHIKNQEVLKNDHDKEVAARKQKQQERRNNLVVKDDSKAQSVSPDQEKDKCVIV